MSNQSELIETKKNLTTLFRAMLAGFAVIAATLLGVINYALDSKLHREIAEQLNTELPKYLLIIQYERDLKAAKELSDAERENVRARLAQLESTAKENRQLIVNNQREIIERLHALELLVRDATKKNP
jgi:hypothetical protein